jgi:cytochrome c oxidase assembly protein subunit 15
MSLFQKSATAALVAVIVLICVGAIVRVTGAGMGCPDWPRCWGRLIPPTRVEQIDISKLDYQKFQKAAARHGLEPSAVTPEHILESFNPVHTWIEFFNRLTSLPVGFFSMAALVLALLRERRRPLVRPAAFVSVVLVGVNAWMGARVVSSNLMPGVLTIHMALAMLVVIPMTFMAWRGCEQPWTIAGDEAFRQRMRWITGLLLVLIFVEGVLGTRIRELNSNLAKTHLGMGRAEWIGILEHTWAYLIHRSFSWLILATAAFAWWRSRQVGRPGKAATGALVVVLGQMVLGLIMARVEIHPAVQVAHLGLSAILLSLTMLWFCGTFRPRARA